MKNSGKEEELLVELLDELANFPCVDEQVWLVASYCIAKSYKIANIKTRGRKL